MQTEYTYTRLDRLWLTLTAIAILVLGLTLSACGVGSQPGTVGNGAFSAPALVGDLQILTRLSTDFNQEPGTLHISDADNACIQTYSAVATAGLQAYIAGSSKLDSARLALDTLNLPPGPLAAARAAFDRAIDVHGAGGSTLLMVRDAYTALWAGLSIDGTKHPTLVTVFQVINGAISLIPLT